jgi:dihydroorotate dehydrogenase (fumarate)
MKPTKVLRAPLTQPQEMAKVDLSTSYLGLELPHPFTPGACPLTFDLDSVRLLEDAGAAAIVLPSLFEEQIVLDQKAMTHFLEAPSDTFAEALSYLPEPADFAIGPEEYLGQLSRIREAVAIPIVASLNGRRKGQWVDYAALLQEAGANALEMNIYQLVSDPSESAAVVEGETIDLVQAVCSTIEIPVAVKLSSFHSSLPHLAAELGRVGAAGLVIFNRFYQPDINIEELDVEPTLRLSDPSELLLRLRWLAILSGRVDLSLAVTGGVHSAADAIKAVMAGAHAVQVVSALLLRGPDHLRTLRSDLEEWLEEHEYESLRQMQGSMNLQRCPDTSAYERANYIRVLQSFHT